MTDLSKAEWHNKAQNLNIRAQMLIDGRLVDAASGKTFGSKSPVDGRHLAEVACAAQADVDRAAAVAREAFEDGRWSRQSPADRKLVLRRLADLIRTYRDELALLETPDIGKPISCSTSIDVRAVANCFDWYGEAIDKIYDEIAPTADGTVAMVTKEPLGVVAAVVPWNFPMLMATWKVAPALATGNSVVLKPAEQ